MSEQAPPENAETHKQWRQGDFAIDCGPFLFADVPDADDTELLAAAFDDPDPVGLVVVSQTCDIVSSMAKLQSVAVCPLIKVRVEHIQMIAKGLSPRFGLVQNANDGVVADLARPMSVNKALLATWRRQEGFSDADAAIGFARSLERVYGRFAFPDAFNDSIRPLLEKIKSKHGKADSPLGKALRSLEELRVRPSGPWDGTVVEVAFFLIFAPADLREVNPLKIKEEFENALKGLLWVRPFSLSSLGVRLGDYDDFTARDYVESVPLDLNALSFAASYNTGKKS